MNLESRSFSRKFTPCWMTTAEITTSIPATGAEVGQVAKRIAEGRSQAETMANGSFNFAQGCPGDFSGARPIESRGIKRAELEAKKNSFHWQAAFRRGNADVGGIIARDVFAFRADDNGNDQRQTVDDVDRKNQDSPASRLFPALHRVEVDHGDVAAFDSRQILPKPSDSAAMNSVLMERRSRWICGSLDIAFNSLKMSLSALPQVFSKDSSESFSHASRSVSDSMVTRTWAFSGSDNGCGRTSLPLS